MPRYDFVSQRLYVEGDLKSGKSINLDRKQANYLINVLRLPPNSPVLVFNGQDGEWQSNLEVAGRKKASLVVTTQTRPQSGPANLRYLFAPLKQARMEYVVQKAVEMGAGILQPVITRFTQPRKLNQERMMAHTIEAAEQCGILTIPQINPALDLEPAVAEATRNGQLIFCDEGETSQNPLTILEKLVPGPLSILIGPEGGFSEEERAMLRNHPDVTPIPLGPRILRADTAAVAAMALVQARLGDWQD